MISITYENKIAFRVLGKPIPQSRPRHGKYHDYYDPKIVEYRERVKASALEALAHFPNWDRYTEKPLDMYLFIYLPIPASWSKKRQCMANEGLIMPTTKPDSSNILKGIEDALNGVLYKDDSQIVKTHMVKQYCFNPAVQIILQEIKAEKVVENF